MNGFKAKNPQELVKLMEENPYEYASCFLEDGSFAFSCYGRYSYLELMELHEKKEPDPVECKTWNVSEQEWKNGIELAMLAYQYETD